MVQGSRSQRPNIGGERTLLVDRFRPTRDMRAKVLRENGVDVDAAESLDEARFFFQAGRDDLVLLAVRRYPELLVFCRLIHNINPEQPIALLLAGNTQWRCC